MNSLLDILGAAVAGGLVVLALVASLNTFSETNTALSRNLSLQERAEVLMDAIKSDISSIGINVPAGTAAVLTADSTNFLFLGDRNHDGTADTTGYYESSVSLANGTSALIKRRESAAAGSGDDLGRAAVRFTYFDQNGAPTAVLSEIHSVMFTLRLEDYVDMAEKTAKTALRFRVYLQNIK